MCPWLVLSERNRVFLCCRSNWTDKPWLPPSAQIGMPDESVAAEKCGASQLLTLDENDFESLLDTVKVEQV